LDLTNYWGKFYGKGEGFQEKVLFSTQENFYGVRLNWLGLGTTSKIQLPRKGMAIFFSQKGGKRKPKEKRRRQRRNGNTGFTLGDGVTKELSGD